MKVSKEALVACITALRRYASLNHATLLQKREERVKYWMEALANIPHVRVERVSPDPEKDEYAIYYSTDPGPTVSAVIAYIQAQGNTLIGLRVERLFLKDRFLEITNTGY